MDRERGSHGRCDPIRARPGEIILDAGVHEQDLRATLAAPPTPDPAVVRHITTEFGSYAVEDAARRGAPSLQLAATDVDRSSGKPDGDVIEGAEP